MDQKTTDLEGKIMGYEKKTLAAAVVLIIVALGSFYVGAKYEKHKLTSLGLLKGNSKPAAEETGNKIKGTVTAKDDKSVTIKMADGSTKVIEFSPGMTFGANGNDSANDLFIGELLVITGDNDADGNFVPTNIRISKKSPKRSEVAPQPDAATPTETMTNAPSTEKTTSTTSTPAAE